MVVVFVLAGLAVLGAVVALAMGKGGELAGIQPDHVPLPPFSGRPLTGAEAAELRPPHSLWGYNPAFTDEAMRRMAYSLAERDAQVTALERQLAELRAGGREEPPPLPWDEPVELTKVEREEDE
ncbi:hypothetical protein [Actinomadura macrotermitis]|uniref:DivIVA domain-containing protein n=1 Tax=Actinomadura macrotermitis TaxID=2585200 RepID=A0A7K0BR46_9ACTN|nr:hypothetical protein [Actinomadura macrotermitis]MQY03639.1 hypothetical protein [Actinomadura macrotermitis]